MSLRKIIAEFSKETLDRIKKFIDLHKNTSTKKPQKPKVNLRSSRDYRLIIRQGALEKKQVVIIYKKITTGEVKRYTVCPLSYRYRKLKAGLRKVLFCIDVDEKQLKMYVIKNIRQATMTSKKYISISFPIEIS